MANFLPARLAAFAVIGATLCSASLAQGYPDKPVKLVIPYAAGGSGDLTARALGQQLTAQWKQPVVIEFKPGASNIVAAQTVAGAPKDGYTLLLCSTAIATNEVVFKSLPYKYSDLTGVSLFVRLPYVAVASNNTGAGKVSEFFEHAKKNPGKVNFASLGPASPANFLARAFARQGGIEMTEIPYKGTGQITPELMAGTVHFYFDGVATALAMQKNGQAKVLGVASEQRLPLAPDTPTLREQGLNFVYESWFGICAPSGTPAAVLATINENVRKAVASEEFQTRMRQVSAIPASSPSPEHFSRYMKEEVEAWAKVIKPLNLQLE